MIHDHDIDRVLDQWFAEGPTQMPSRFLDDTLDRIDRAPKRRLVGLRPGFVRPNSQRLIAAAAVVALVVAGIGSVFLKAPAVGVNPSSSPSASSVSDPASLIGSWTSDGTRHMPFQNGSHTLDTTTRVDIAIGATDIRWADTNSDVVNSKAIVGPETIEFRMVAASPPEWKCQVSDVGTYRFTVSATGQELTLTPIADPCSARKAILGGGWLRTDMGDLAPGPHVSTLFKPFGDATGQFAYSVPPGWTDRLECAACLTLGSASSSIELLSNVAPSSTGTSCDTGLAGVGATPTDIAAWVTSLPSLVVTKPTAVTVGGLHGVSIDLSASETGATGACAFLANGSGDASLVSPDVPDRQLSVLSDGLSRWILLDRGDGSTLLVNLESPDKARWNAFLADVMPVVNTFVFTGTLTPTASSAASSFADSALLRSKWTSVGDRSDPTIPSPYSASVIFNASVVSLSGFKEDLSNSWALVEPGRLEFRVLSLSIGWNCLPGDLGTYTVDLSADGQTMTLARVDDACATRAAVLTGDWTRWPCPNPNSVCQPKLEPGRHVSPFVPSVAAGEQSFPPTFLSAFSYAVPPGWSQIDSTTLGRPNDPYSLAIMLIPDVAPHTQASDCHDGIEPGVESTASGLTQWLKTVPGLVATKPAPTEIGGYKGFMVDVAVAPTWMVPCQSFFSNPVRAVFTFADHGGPNVSVIREYLEGDAHARYIVLDVGSGHNLLIEIGAPYQAAWDEYIQAAMPIVESLRFVPR